MKKFTDSEEDFPKKKSSELPARTVVGGSSYYYKDWSWSKKGSTYKGGLDDSYYDSDYYGDYYYGSHSSYRGGGYFSTPSSRNYSSSLGWSRGSFLKSVSNYSSLKDTGDLLKKAYKAVKDIIVVLNLPFKMTIKISNRSDEFVLRESYDKFIVLPTKIVDEEYENDEKVNYLVANGIHEIAHILKSEYSVYKSFIEEVLPKEDPPLSAAEKALATLFADLVEDNRVEDEILLERPGLLDYLEKFRSISCKRLSKNAWSRDPKVESTLRNLYKLLRYSEELDEENMLEFKELFIKFKSIAKVSDSTKNSCLIGLELFKTLKNNFDDLKLNEYNLENTLSSISMRYGSDTEFDKYVDGDCDTYVDDSNEGDSKEDAKVRGKKRKRTSLSSSEMSSKVVDSHLLEKMLLDKYIEGDDKTYYEKLSGDKSQYISIKDEISKYIPSLRKIMKGTSKNYDFNIYGCRSGLLDVTKLAEAYQGVPQVYIRQGHVRTNKTTLGILLDESGSMGCTERFGSSTLSRYEIVKRAAILINEAFKDDKGVDLYIYGHSADELCESEDTQVRIYKEGSYYNPSYSLTSVRARVENRDGNAILGTVKRIRQFTDEHLILLVLSDGSPCASDYYGAPAMRHVRQCVDTVTKKYNTDVVQVSISKVSGVEKMFDNYIDLTGDLTDFPKKLGSIVKKLVLKDRKTTVTQ